MRVADYTTEEIQAFCNDSFSYAEVLRKMNMSGGGSQATLKKRIEKDGIDISHFKGQGWNKESVRNTISWLFSRPSSNFNSFFTTWSTV